MLLNPLTFHSPKTSAEASQLAASLPDVKILAGGTFLLNSLKLLKKKGTKTPQHVISLRKVDELRGIEADEKQLTIRAMTIINDLFDSPLLEDNFEILHTVCRNISTNPIRNMATVGGNLTCRYTWTEMGAVMIALDAQMHFVGADGKSVVMSADDFFKNNAKTDKIFTHVTIPRDKNARIAYRRVRKTMHVDIPLLAVCIRAHFQGDRFADTRVTVNSGTAFAQRDLVLEKFLNSAEAREGIAKEALDHLDVNIYDKRSDDYKKHMFRVSIKSMLEELLEKRRTH
ncbi:MAG: FAD binding domain-containing protein [Candidatus Omnitrophota bacterium]|nr:FAD binding domain-containing protein [Candidatus Omnitrophota bacterium]MDZ4242824.1 FAD binding domain-containing protein [Candidatus Omnitrophota bacterium]